MTPESHDLRLASTQDAPGAARRAVVGWLDGRVPEDALQDVKLLVSELVTNGVRHAPDADLELHLDHDGTRVRVEVTDAGGVFDPDAPVEPAWDAEGGRGLLIVDRVATRWGTAHDGRNVVWFEC